MHLPQLLAFFVLPCISLAAQEGGQPEVLLHFDGSRQSVRLGESIGLGGDFDADGNPDIILGAEFADTLGFTRNGMVQVYSGALGTLLLQLDGNASFENFGTSVTAINDINGDGIDDILVGTPGADPFGLTDAGEIDLFSGNNGTLLLHIDGTVASGRFGAQVVALSDLDGDGLPDFAASEPGRNSNAGRVYVYSGLSGTILFQLDGNPGDAMGTALSSAGDYDLDGIEDLFVGSPNADTQLLTDNGIAQVYSGASGLPLFLLEGVATQDHFGQALDGGFFVNQDNIPDFIVGAPNHDPGGVPSAGAATVFSGANGNILFEVFGVALADDLGSSVALTGDIDGDGFGDFIVGARLFDAGGLFDAGSAFTFSGRNGALLIRAAGASPQDNLGDTVTGGVDMNLDGYPDIAYAAPLADSVAQLAGTVDVERVVPALVLSANSVSVAIGSSTDFFINFPPSEAGVNYILLASRTGMGPTSLRGASIPLTVDPIFQTMAAGGPPQFTASIGTLDVFGNAVANLNLQPGTASSLINTTLYFAAVSQLNGTPRLVSNADSLLILP